jgi:hypothetical protein
MIKDTSNERFWRIKFLDGATSKLEKHAETWVPVDTIEACGGGSARCMMVEIFYQKTISKALT